MKTDRFAMTITDGTGTFYFAGKPIRFILKENEPWFFAIDCGKALGMTNVRMIIAKYPEDEKGVNSIYTLGGNQAMAIISLPRLLQTPSLPGPGPANGATREKQIPFS